MKNEKKTARYGKKRKLKNSICFKLVVSNSKMLDRLKRLWPLKKHAYKIANFVELGIRAPKNETEEKKNGKRTRLKKSSLRKSNRT
jgi:hypothetical protein